MSTQDNAFDISNVAIAWDGTQGGAGAACCGGGRVQYAFPDQDWMLNLLTADLSVYQSSHVFSDLNTWTAKNIADQFPSSLRGRFHLKQSRFLSIVSLGEYTYVFWVSDSGYFALRTRPDMLEPVAVAEIDFSDWSGYTYKSNLAAFAMPSSTPIIAGKIGAVVFAEYAGTSGEMMPVLFDPGEFTPNGKWLARRSNGGYTALLSPLIAHSDNGLAVTGTYRSVSAGWIDQGSVQASGDAAPRPYLSLVVVCNADDSSVKTLSFGTDLLGAFDRDFRMQYHFNGNVQLTSIQAEHGDSGLSWGASVIAAPDGSMCAHFRDRDNHVQTAKLVPNSASASSSSYHQPGLHSPVWQTTPVYLAGSTSSLTTHNSPCGVYLPLATTVAPAPCPLTKADGLGTEVFAACPSVKFIHMILSSDGNNKPRLSTSYWGTFFSVQNYRIDSATSDYLGVTLVSMVADAFPYPVPDRSIWGPDSPSGMVNWLLCSYEYLTSESSEMDLDYEFQIGVGVKGEAIVTTGIGVQADAEDLAGISALVRTSDLTIKASSLTVTTKGVPPVSTSDPAELLRISGEGTFFGLTPPAKMGTDVTMVQPRGSESVSSFMAVTVHPILDGSVTARSGDYRSYCYTPGQLQTYDPAQIGHTMAQRFGSLSAADKRDFVIDGVDYSSLYASDYVDRVCAKFGRNCFGPAGNLPYLEFSFSEGGIQRSEYQSTSSFTAGGGVYANHSAYAGLAWNIEVENSVGAFGVYEVTIPIFNSSGYLMVGVEWSTSLVAQNSNSSSWGVKLGEYLNPLAQGEAYTVRMYLLAPSPLWAVEMKHFGFAPGDVVAQKIDFMHSSPVRILFTVPYVSPALTTRLARGG